MNGMGIGGMGIGGSIGARGKILLWGLSALLAAAVPLSASALASGSAPGGRASGVASASRGDGRAGAPVASAARRSYLNEKARLRFSSEHGSTLVERGYAYGTYDGAVVADLTIHSKSVDATVTLYPHGGSITGSADASYRVVKNLGYFGGTFNLGRGSGKFGHVAEVGHKPLGISGVINRYNFELEVKANGEVSGV